MSPGEAPYIVLSNLHREGIVPSRRFASLDGALTYLRDSVDRLLAATPASPKLRKRIWNNVAMSVCREQQGTGIHKGVAVIAVSEDGSVRMVTPEGAVLHEWSKGRVELV